MAKGIITTLLLILSLSGWISGTFFYFQAKENDKFLMEKSLDNSLNIISQMLQRNNNDDGVIEQINLSINKGWTAHTGPLTTLCENDQDRLLTIVTKINAEQICDLVPKGKYY
ncbi:hypothetical protein HPQ32_05250 [Photobacterium carnosum]|uniref:hypothetical protein n=1 Tax=Photobacterium carnosum TaxID=2023717 RepID=UPI001C92669A|nr:hypothetical protein [Photobacterium carnosum]MBY3787845.1 hypothetical protein [Photobacterium carnosum]MCD9494176.1 hypothetical protein [Photobacterium carnosum]MCD9498918.1 hypothetical protein [Photobacterium carnosum]MCD9533187.1 hypothetical protein [Photobacterium carnosum]MCD9537283.1 hypothetical protein [Photobacterium carnosum]